MMSFKTEAMEIAHNEGNCECWKTFQQSFEDLALMEGIYKLPQAHQLARFRHAFGYANRELRRNLGLGAVEKDDAADPQGLKSCKTVATIIMPLKKRFARHRNVIHRRYAFHKST